eukprot:TRINITY_DN6881_c1_g1_i1.p1 TRINITY_DN6881_c1_g1~~TRINITY_DN6881_c1_g1_i1.p1  ORF type:complete len:255 (-),score=21.99 TRINITY_DN6881_c1_g1_i1:291-1055(-)
MVDQVQVKRHGVVPKLTAKQIYGELQGRQLYGVLMGPHIWLAVNESERSELNALCVGYMDGGPKTAHLILQTLQAAEISQQSSFNQSSKRRAQRNEAIKLSLQEALFFMEKLNCLNIIDFESKQTIGLLRLWNICLKLRGDSFLSSYAIYKHYRSLGWLVRAGIQYGGEYVLYRGHPGCFHSDYIVLPIPLSPLHKISWQQIQVGQRLAGNVRKKLLLVYVYVPSDIDLADLASTDKLKIEEVEASRWIPREVK